MVREGGFCFFIFTSWYVAPANFYWRCELPATQKIVSQRNASERLDAYTHIKQKIRIKREKKAI